MVRAGPKPSTRGSKMELDIPRRHLVQRASARGALWLIGISLAAIAIGMFVPNGEVVSPALAQPVMHAGARGVFAFTGRLSQNSFGLFMVDVDAMTIWCYEYLGGSKELRLVAARSWMYDRYLENFNCEGPSPSEIEIYVQQERENKLRNRGNK